jgi:3-hydroxyacyl-CoA dehydrogenase
MNGQAIWVAGPPELVLEFQEQFPLPTVAAPDEADWIVVLDLEPDALRSRWERLPENRAIRLVNATTVLALECALRSPYPDRVVGLHLLPGLLRLEQLELVRTELTSPEVEARVEALCRGSGKTPQWVADRIGGVLPRMLCALINEACTAVQEQVAAPEEVDVAMELGTNYPRGPFAWMRQLGARNVMTVLEALFMDLGEPRYRISPVLRRYALLEPVSQGEARTR